MEEWKEYRLGEVVNILDYKRIPLSSVERKTREGGFPYYGAQGIIDYIDDYIFDGTYLLIAEDGENLKSKKQDIAQLAHGKYWVNNHAHIVESNGICDIRYLCYILNNIDLSGYITGSAQPKLNQANLSAISIILPSLNLQEQIADFISMFDNKIELNRRINDNLEQQAQALFNEMFPHITEGENMIGDLIMPKRGKGLLSKNAIKGDIPVVAGGIEPATYHNQANTTAPVLTIAASGANAGYINLWHIPVWASDSSYIDDSITPNVYFWYIMLKKRQKEIFDAQVGSAQPHIYPKHIAELPMNVVFVEKIAEYNEIVTPIFERKGQLFLESKHLTSLRDTLLPKLMSGELKINDINN